MAYQTAPNSSFVIHAGDLVDDAHLDYECEKEKEGIRNHEGKPSPPIDT